MIDAFVQSELRELVESEFHERGQHPSCPAGYNGATFHLGYIEGIHQVQSVENMHPHGYWTFELRATIHGPSQLPVEFPDFRRSMHLLLVRRPPRPPLPGPHEQFQPTSADYIDGDGGIHRVVAPFPFEVAVPESVPHSAQNNVPPGIFWSESFFYYGFGSNFYGPHVGNPTFLFGAAGGAGFYTWRFPSGEARVETAKVTVRTPTEYCNPRFGLLFYSANTPCVLEVTCKRFDNFIVNFVTAQIAARTIQFTDVTILSNDYALNLGGRSHFWEFSLAVGGWTSTNINPSFVYPAPGQYQVRLTVTDMYGAETHSRVKTVTVL